MKKITKESFLKWWVDGFYSLGLNSVSFNSDGEKFQKVRETIDKRIKDFDKDEDMCELSDDSNYNALVSFRNLFMPSNSCCYYGSLENALRQFCSMGKASFYNESEKIVFTYSKENIDSDAIPNGYKRFVEDISKVML